MVFPTSNRREVVLSSPSGHCWMGQSFSLAPVSLSFRHALISFPVRDFWELLPFWIYFTLFVLFPFSNPPQMTWLGLKPGVISILWLTCISTRILSGGGCPLGVMVKAMECGIVVSEFVLQSRYYVYFRANTLGKGMTSLSSQLWVK